MTDFPAGIRCSSLAHLAGEVPARAHVSTAGNLVQVRATNREVGARLRVAFRNISTADLAAIRSHYQGEGTIRSWLLSTVLLDGAEFASEIATMRWRYVSPPQARDITTNVHELELELEHVPVLDWQEDYVAEADPGAMALGAAANLVGPDALPLIWASRLTAAGTSEPNQAAGGIAINPGTGDSYQAFFFVETSAHPDARLVVVKRNTGGVIQWQRWTDAVVGNAFAGLSSYPPAVAPVAGGGCLVACKINSSINGNTTRVWRLEGDGDEAWRKDLTISCSGPMALHADAQGEAWIGTDVLVSGRNVPALIRLDIDDGAHIGTRSFDIDSGETSFMRVLPLASGRVLLLARVLGYDHTTQKKSYLLELSADLATVHASYGYGSSDASGEERLYDGPVAITAAGDVLISVRKGSTGGGILRLNSSYAVQANRAYESIAAGLPVPQAMAIAADGTGYQLYWAGNLSSYSTPSTVGMAAVALANNGQTISSLTEVTTIYETRPVPASTGCYTYQQLDLVSGRFVAHAKSGMNVIALGWALPQLPDETSLAITPGTLRSKTSALASGAATAGPTVTRYSATVTSAAITPTIATGSLQMVNASGSLSWSLAKTFG